MAKQTTLKKKSGVKKEGSKKKTLKEKPVKKKTQGKKPSKTSVKKKLKKKIPEEHFFMLITGARLRNIKELADALENIDISHYEHHVNENKNDFANWIKDVFEEFDLAEKIKTAKNKDHARFIIYKHICNSFW